MNKQSNTYTAIYIIVLVLIVGTALAVTSLLLHDKQQANADADKMRQILAAVHITPASDEIISDFGRYITESHVINNLGEEISDVDAFSVDVAAQSKMSDESARELPVYICNLPDGEIKYILPMYGAGLWGPIWGYISIDDDGSTVYGAYFAHQSETPGLGAEIAKTDFSDQFKGKHLIKNGMFSPIAVVKSGKQPSSDEDYVDGISGGTITSKGVSDMLAKCLKPYATYLNNLSKKH